MYCPRCGDSVEDADRFCSSCGQDLVTYRNLWASAPGSAPSPAAASPASPALVGPPHVHATEPTPGLPQISTYLGWASALVTLCWPAFWAGIPAVVYAGRAESLLAAGDLVGAQTAANKSKTWCWVTLWAGLVLWAVALTLVVTL